MRKVKALQGEIDNRAYLIFFGVRSIFITPNEHKSCSEATSENTAFGVHERNKSQSYTGKKIKFFVAFMLMHQSFVSPAPMGPGIPGTYRGLSAGI